MAGRNGSGTYTRSYDFTADRDAGSPTNVISADRVDDELDGIATALTASIAKDGQTVPTADLPMGGFKHSNVATAAPAARSVYLSVAAAQDHTYDFIAAGGTADAITATFVPALTALTNGCEVCVRALLANATATPTFAPNGLTAKTIVKGANAALVANDIAGLHHELRLRYNSTTDHWHLLNPTIAAGDSATVVNSGGTLVVALPRRASTGTTDALVTADRGKHVTQSNSSPVAVSLAQAGSAGFTSGWHCYVENLAAGLVTITPATSTINGAATLKLQTGEAYLITSDETNYRAIACGRSTLAETAVEFAADTLSMFDTSTATRKAVSPQVLFDALNSLTAKTPVVGDKLAVSDSAASGVAKNVTITALQTLLAALAADQETATSTTLFVTPAVQQRHPSACKAWGVIDVAGTPGALLASYNITSVARNGNGDYTVTIATDFSSANYAVVVTANGTARFCNTNTIAAGTFNINVLNTSGVPVDSSVTSISFQCFGDQ